MKTRDASSLPRGTTYNEASGYAQLRDNLQRAALDVLQGSRMTAHIPHAFDQRSQAGARAPTEPRPPTVNAARSIALLALGYFVAASFTLITTRIDGTIAYCWMATAVLMPHLVRLPTSRWPAPLVACALASIIASSLFGAGPLPAAPIALALVGEAAIGAWLLRRFAADGRYFEDVPRLARYAVLIGGVMPILPAFVGAAVGSFAFGMSFWAAWLAWYTVHGLGALTFSPVVVLLTEDAGRHRLAVFDPRRGGIINLGLALAMVVVVGLTFGQSRLPLFFLPLLPLTLLTLRAGRLGAALGISILAVGGGALTMAGSGPAALASDNHASMAMFFQFYLAVSVITVLPMAAELNRRKALSRRLQDSEAMFRLMADRSGDILLNVDVKGRIRFCSSSIARFGGFDPAALVGESSLELIAEEDRVVVAAVHGRALARPDETFIYEYRAMTSPEAMTWFESHTRAILDDDGIVTGVVSAARDISQRKRAEAKLVDTANTDSLTGISNRRRFDERLRQAMRAANRAASAGCLAIVDIDFFKRVNDQHGHPAGDKVLQAVAARLQPMLRATDLVARIGGEEFGLVLWGLQLADANRLCDRLREDIAAQQLAIGTATLAVTVSIGIADLAGHATIAAVLAAADAALYRAKAEGRNRVRQAA